jgi:cytochrome P450
MTETLPADPFTATAADARHAAYAELAAAGPVHRITLPTGEPAWLITSHDEARRALTNPRLIKGRPLHGALSDQLPPDVKSAVGNHLLYHNPPDHTRLRRLVSAAFTRRRVEQLAPRIQQIADALLDALDGTVETDLIATFAYPLPMTVICELLGVPEGDRNDFRGWTSTSIAGPFAGTETYVAAATTMVGYCRELLADKRRNPTDDLLSALVEVRDGGDRLSEDELIAMVFLLVAAGHETTVNLIGNGVHALLTHPQQLALLRAEPERLPAVVEELLRFAGPLQVSMPLITAEPVELAGVTIPAGETVFAGLLAANRDPARVANPAELDISRAEHSHLAFGHGIHHCLGAPLARLEGQIALQTLLSRFPRLRLAVPPHELTWQPSLLLHSLTTLPVLLR